MKVSIIGSTKPNYVAGKEEIELFSGHNAGVCYMPGSFNELVNEDVEKTNKRVLQTKGSGHHSVFDHAMINFYLEDIPKALAMVLNNEKQYTTSEKSARYTKMILKEDEKKLYDKWLEIFKKLIRGRYQEKYPKIFTEKKIEKLAQENARYLISVFTPTSMVYSTTYRQLNYIYHMMQKEINKDDNQQNRFYKMLKPAMIDFCECIQKTTPYFDELISADSKGRTLSLMNFNDHLVEYFGDVYATNYTTSFACLAQAQRHRTLSYSFKLKDDDEFYVPPILMHDKDLIKEWREDCQKQARVYPQGLLISVNEMGSFENFVLKMMERKCTFAQLEINNQTNETLKKYIENLQKSSHPRASEMSMYANGSRCTFPNFKCTSPCGFPDGVNETREI